MLRFAIPTEGGSPKKWSLGSAHVLGPDDVAVSSDVTLRDGVIECRKPGSGTGALCLLYDAGSRGRLMLQTCLLPDRQEPYLLSLELARHRIKTFLAKSEEWQMFELEADSPAMALWEESRQIFTKALNAPDHADADRFGRESLDKAIEASERLAMLHAEILLHRRFSQRPASSTTLGVRIAPTRPPASYADLLDREFDLLYLPLNWRYLEPSEGRYDWELIDTWMEWAVKHKKPIVAGPLIDFSKQALPEWMHVWHHDYDTCRDLVYDHVEKVTHRYRDVVSIWSIAAGLNVNDNFRFKPREMLDLTRMANLVVRQGPRRTRTMLEIVHPFGEHVGSSKDSLPPLTYIDRVVQEGIRVDCYGLQLLFGGKDCGRTTRDLMQMSSLLDRFFLLELPVLVTRIGVPSGATDPDAGSLGSPWSPQVQADWAAKAFRIALSKPYVDSFFWSDLFDSENSDFPHGGLIDGTGNAKPALAQLTELRRKLRKPLGPIEMPDLIGA